MDFDYVLRVLVVKLFENQESTLAEISTGHHEHDDEPNPHGPILELRHIALKSSLIFSSERKASELANLWLDCTSTIDSSILLTAMASSLLNVNIL